MPSETIIVDLDDAAVKRRLLLKLGAMSGPWEIEFKKWKPRRSNRANAFYHAVVVKALQNYLAEQGDALTPDQCHEILKVHMLPVDVANPRTGEIICRIGGSTAALNVTEFSEYVERCIAWLAGFGIVLPDESMVSQ